MLRGLAARWVMQLGLTGVLFALAACSPSPQPQGEQGSARAAVAAPAASANATTVPQPAIATTQATTVSAPAPVLSEEAIVEQVSAVVKRHQLSSLPPQCLDYMVDDADAATIDIDVHEKHDATCGGDPATSPRLFSFKLERANGRLSTDALDLADGDYQPID